MNVLYIHAGANCFGDVFTERGHTFHSIELNKEFSNIPFYDFNYGFYTESIIEAFGEIDILLASPDCRSYSPAGYNYYKRDPMDGYKTTVQHGINCDIFTNYPDPDFKPPCPGRSANHVHATLCNSRKMKKSGKYKNAKDRSLIPNELCHYIVDLCEKGEYKMSTQYNKTQLTPGYFFEKHVYHRDMFAHYFRWTHMLKVARIGQTILDFGCGTAEMLEVFYRNRFKPKYYLGLDIREKTIVSNEQKFKDLDFAEFRQCDLCQDELDLGRTFDIITCFEVMEHIGHDNADAFLDNIAYHCGPNTRVYLSTPNYDPKVGAAKNHTLRRADGTEEIGEWDHFELQEKLSEYFDIEAKYGTFASIKDYKEEISQDWRKVMFDELSKYYDSNMLSVIMAPLVKPENARNCLWVLKAKPENEVFGEE